MSAQHQSPAHLSRLRQRAPGPIVPLHIPLDAARPGGPSVVEADYEVLDADERGALLRLEQIPQQIEWIAPGEPVIAAFDRDRRVLKAIRKPESKDWLRFHRGEVRLHLEKTAPSRLQEKSDPLDSDWVIKRERLMASIREQHMRQVNVPPVVPLDDYFDGNTKEDSIAPNQWGEGRPPLSELWARFRAIGERSEVQLLLVGIHSDWESLDADLSSWPPAENVHIYSSAPLEEVESWISGMAADGLIEGWPYGKHPTAPQPHAGFAVLTICWD